MVTGLGVFDVLELASTDVEQGGDAVTVDVEAVGDQVVISAQGTKAKPEPVGPGELGEPGGIHFVTVDDAGADVPSTRY
jgi:hypothetical protein